MENERHFKKRKEKISLMRGKKESVPDYNDCERGKTTGNQQSRSPLERKKREMWAGMIFFSSFLKDNSKRGKPTNNPTVVQ